MKIVQTPTFSKTVKNLHSNQKKDLDEAVRDVIKDPSVGDLKKGDLNGIQVYKFKMVNQLTLLAYQITDKGLVLILLALGSHENFYRDLKR